MSTGSRRHPPPSSIPVPSATKKKPSDEEIYAFNKVSILSVQGIKLLQEPSKDIKKRNMKILKGFLKSLFNKKNNGANKASPTAMECRRAVQFFRNIKQGVFVNEMVANRVGKYLDVLFKSLPEILSPCYKQKQAQDSLQGVEEMIQSIVNGSEHMLSQVLRCYNIARQKTRIAEWALCVNAVPIADEIVYMRKPVKDEFSSKIRDGPRFIDLYFLPNMLSNNEDEPTDLKTQSKQQKIQAVTLYSNIIQPQQIPALSISMPTSTNNAAFLQSAMMTLNATNNFPSFETSEKGRICFDAIAHLNRLQTQQMYLMLLKAIPNSMTSTDLPSMMVNMLTSIVTTTLNTRYETLKRVTSIHNSPNTREVALVLSRRMREAYKGLLSTSTLKADLFEKNNSHPLLEDILGVLIRNSTCIDSGLFLEVMARDFDDIGITNCEEKPLTAIEGNKKIDEPTLNGKRTANQSLNEFEDPLSFIYENAGIFVKELIKKVENGNLHETTYYIPSNCRSKFLALLFLLLNDFTRQFFELLLPSLIGNQNRETTGLFNNNIRRKILYIYCINKVDEKLTSSIFGIKPSFFPTNKIVIPSEILYFSAAVGKTRETMLYNFLLNQVTSQTMAKWIFKYSKIGTNLARGSKVSEKQKISYEIFQFVIKLLFKCATKVNALNYLVACISHAVQSVMYEAIIIRGDVEYAPSKRKDRLTEEDIVIFIDDKMSSFEKITLRQSPVKTLLNLNELIVSADELINRNRYRKPIHSLGEINLMPLFERVVGLQNEKSNEWNSFMRDERRDQTRKVCLVARGVDVPFGVSLAGAIEECMYSVYASLDLEKVCSQLVEWRVKDKDKDEDQWKPTAGVGRDYDVDGRVKLLVKYIKYVPNRTAFVGFLRRSLGVRLVMLSGLISGLMGLDRGIEIDVNDRCRISGLLQRCVAQTEDRLLDVLEGNINSSDHEIMRQMVETFGSSQLEDKLINGMHVIAIQGEGWQDSTVGAPHFEGGRANLKTQHRRDMSEMHPTDIHFFSNKERNGFLVISEEMMVELEAALVDDSIGDMEEVMLRIVRSFPGTNHLQEMGGVNAVGQYGLSLRGYTFIHHMMFRRVPRTKKSKPTSDVTSPEYYNGDTNVNAILQNNEEINLNIGKEDIEVEVPAGTRTEDIEGDKYERYDNEYEYEDDEFEGTDDRSVVPIIQLRTFKRCYLNCCVFSILKQRSCSMNNLLSFVNDELVSMGFQGDITINELKDTVEQSLSKMALVRDGDIISLSE